MTRQIIKLIGKWAVAEFVKDGELNTAHVLDEMCDVFRKPDTNEWTRAERILLDLCLDVVLLVPFLWIATTGGLAYGIRVLYGIADRTVTALEFKM